MYRFMLTICFVMFECQASWGCFLPDVDFPAHPLKHLIHLEKFGYVSKFTYV